MSTKDSTVQIKTGAIDTLKLKEWEAYENISKPETEIFKKKFTSVSGESKNAEATLVEFSDGNFVLKFFFWIDGINILDFNYAFISSALPVRHEFNNKYEEACDIAKHYIDQAEEEIKKVFKIRRDEMETNYANMAKEREESFIKVDGSVVGIVSDSIAKRGDEILVIEFEIKKEDSEPTIDYFVNKNHSESESGWTQSLQLIDRNKEMNIVTLINEREIKSGGKVNFDQIKNGIIYSIIAAAQKMEIIVTDDFFENGMAKCMGILDKSYYMRERLIAGEPLAEQLEKMMDHGCRYYLLHYLVPSSISNIPCTEWEKGKGMVTLSELFDWLEAIREKGPRVCSAYWECFNEIGSSLAIAEKYIGDIDKLEEYVKEIYQSENWWNRIPEEITDSIDWCYVVRHRIDSNDFVEYDEIYFEA